MEFLQKISESSLSRLHSKMQEYSCGAITAYRGEFTKRENQQRNRSLLASLMAKGYSVTAVRGSYIENYGSEDAREVSEHTFWVCSKEQGDDGGQLERDLIELGHKFDQDSILAKPYGEKASLVGTSDRENAFPKKGERFTVGSFKGGKAAEFMSRVNDREFTFEEFSAPATINGIRGLKIAAEMNWKDLEPLILE